MKVEPRQIIMALAYTVIILLELIAIMLFYALLIRCDRA